MEKIKNLFTNKKIILAISLILFTIVTIILLSGKLSQLDENIQSKIMEMRNDNLTNVMIIITNICSIYTFSAISLLLLFTIKNKKIPIAIIINLICITLISQLFKFIIRRDRPVGISLISESGFSYPSGHSMVSMAYYGLIAYLIYKNLKSKTLKIILIIFIFIGIFLIGFSRIYLGVHYFTDIMGGFLASIAYLMIFIHFYKKITTKEKDNNEKKNKKEINMEETA